MSVKLSRLIKRCLVELLYITTLAYMLFQQAFTGRMNVHSLILAFLFGLLSIVYGYLMGDIRDAIIGYLASLALATAVSVLLIRRPIEIYISEVSAELVTMHSLRNALIYALFAITPFSIVLIPIGVYLTTVVDSNTMMYVLFISLTLVPSSMLIVSYNRYCGSIYSIRRLEVHVEDISIGLVSNRAFLNMTYTISNGGIREVRIVLINYKIYFGQEIARDVSENFYALPLVIRPHVIVTRYMSVEVPKFKIERNLIASGKLRVSIIFEIYLKTPFGNTPVTFHYTTLLSPLQA
ncbi:MAG: hypothetical protein DRJ66_04025 [Thermoprotei archaeon]|nr:MAG: hypothetical protein DRJ66_04025 [Thermoprotei archaeon]RLF18594.1 MAG: hypothetical protein DRZ82_07950 [Thermoprotei archaeon]